MNKKLLIIVIVVLLLVLSFLPIFSDDLSLGGQIQVNFWQKVFMKID